MRSRRTGLFGIIASPSVRPAWIEERVFRPGCRVAEMTNVSADAAVVGKRAVVRCATDVHTDIGRRVLRQGGTLRQWRRIAGDKADGEGNRYRQMDKPGCHADSPSQVQLPASFERRDEPERSGFDPAEFLRC